MKTMFFALGGALLGAGAAWLFQPEGKRVRRKVALSVRQAGRSTKRTIQRVAHRSREWVAQEQALQHRLQPLVRTGGRLLRKAQVAAQRATQQPAI